MMHLLKKPALCLVTWLASTTVLAQQQSQFVGLTMGVTPVQIKDYFHSPYKYRGSGLSLQATYGQERSKTQWQIDADYSQANPQSVVSRKASTRLFDAAFNYQWRLSSASKAENRFQYFAGMGVRFLGNSTNYSPDIDVATVQATAALSLGASAKVTYRFNAVHGIELQGFASAVSAVYRPHYEYFGKENLAVSWLGQNPIVNAQLTYHYQFSKHFQAIGNYQVSYFQYDQPRQVLWLRQLISVGVRRTF